jgi:hypothetical protein
MSPRKLPNRFRDRAVLRRALDDCNNDQFAHLSEAEQANVRRSIERRIAEIDQEIRRMEEAERS